MAAENGYTVRALTMHDMDTKGADVVNQINALYQILSRHGSRATFASLCQSIRAPFNRHFVALSPDNIIVGMGTYAVVRTARGLRASLEDLCVDPSHRELGLGTDLASCVIQAALADGMTNLDLVSPFNPDTDCNPISHRIYRRLGWKQVPGRVYMMRLKLAIVNPNGPGTTTVDVAG
jgi:GNAT superfamily N-acetyltransferase